MGLEQHEHGGCTYGWMKYKVYVTDCCFQIRFALAFAALAFRGHAKERKKETKKEAFCCQLFFAPTHPGTICVYMCVSAFLSKE